MPVLMAMVMTLTGCELYMDEPGLDDSQVANGDGFSAPATYTDSISTVTYQFKEGTVFINEQYRPYIFRYCADSLNNVAEIWFSKAIPGSLMPSRGSGIATTLLDIFTDGLCHKVDVVEEVDGCYVVKAHAVKPAEIYKQLRVTSDFYIAGDSTDTSDPDDEAEQVNKKARAVPVSHSDRLRLGSDYNASDPEIPLFGIGITIDEFAKSTKLGKVVSKEMKELAEEHPILDRTKKDLVHLDGELDGIVGASCSLKLKLHFDVDFIGGYHDVYIQLINQYFAGILLQKFKGSFVIPLVGWTRSRIKTAEGKWLPVEKNHYIIIKKPLELDTTTGVGLVTLSLDYKLLLEIFGSMEFENPIGIYAMGTLAFPKFGYHVDEDDWHIYPFGGKSKSKSAGAVKANAASADSDVVFTPTPPMLSSAGRPKKVNPWVWGTNPVPYDEFGINEDGFHTIGFENNSFDLSAGLTMHFIIEAGIAWNKVLAIKASADLAYENKLTYSTYEKYKNVQVINQEGTDYEAASSAQKCRYTRRLYFVPSLSGKVETPFKDYDLFDLSADSYYSLDLANRPLAPEFKVDVRFDEDRSDQFSAHYNIYIDYENRPMMKADDAPMVAVFRDRTNGNWSQSGIKLNQMGKPLKNSSHPWRYTLEIPYEQDQIGDTYVAIPVYYFNGTPRYGTATTFRLNGLYGRVKDLEQVKVKNGTVGNSKIYGFKFQIEADGLREVDNWTLSITVCKKGENESDYFTEVANGWYKLGKLTSADIKKYMMFISGNTEDEYLVKVQLGYYEYGLSHYTWQHYDTLKLEFDGGTDEVDYSQLYSSGGYSTGYEILE